VAYSQDERRLGGADSAAIGALVARSHRIQTSANWVLDAVAGAAAVLLASAPGGYAPGLAGAVALALLCRTTGLSRFSDALPSVAAACAALLALLWELPARWGGPWWCGPLAVCGVAALLLAATVWKATRGDRRELPRPGWHGVLDMLASTASLPLAVGVFGVYGDMVSVGHGI
jgi:hypothetical protein